MNKTKESYPLESVLFSIFTDSPYSNFRLPEHMWAVVEALNRVMLSTKPLEAQLWREGDGWLFWRIRKANKDHECARGGCNIKNGEFYFIHSGDDSTDGMKLCARCMALVLYFRNVEKLKPYHFIGWDYEHCEPKHVEKPLLLTGMINDSYFFPESIKYATP